MTMNSPIPTSTLGLDRQLLSDVQYNCDVSDARDHGIYSMCSMVLKLRNLYKWEQGVEPWNEPESAELLDWIDAKEQYWESLSNQSYRPIEINNSTYDPFDVDAINRVQARDNHYYGAGFGRSMKSIFFIAQKTDALEVEGCPVLLLGTEPVREMASPFAMAQDGIILIRTEPLRFFLWDHIQELQSSCRSAFRYTLTSYGLLKNGVLDQQQFKEVLSDMVSQEMGLFIHHEVGEVLQKTLESSTLQAIIGRFPSSVIEFVCRAVKDILADTHPRGVLSYITREQKDTSLGLYVSFLDGLRKELFPEMFEAWDQFTQSNKWGCIEQARLDCRGRSLELGEKITEIAASIDRQPDDQVHNQFNDQILEPLGLGVPRS